MTEAIEIFTLNDEFELETLDDNCIIGWDDRMETYFFYNGSETLLIGGVDGRRYSSVFGILYELIKLGYSFRFWNSDVIDRLIDKTDS